MITRQQAESIAAQILRRPADAPGRSWSLLEFDEGWLVDEEPPPGEEIFGEASRVIERAGGRVLLFPSGVPPRRIMDDYAAVRDEGLVQTPD
jgi:hypothetical protein